MADIIENEEIDKDTVQPEVLEQQFCKKYRLLCEKTTKSYITKLAATRTLKVAVSQSDNSIEVYELNNRLLCRVCRLSGHQKGLSELVFSPVEDHLLYSAGRDGLVKLWDTRASGTCALEYKDEEEELTRPYECLDVSRSGRAVCAGSSLVQDDAYLVFWDARQPRPLGGYWNSHTDDITQVKFHNEKTETLASGSIDGLLNIYNIAEATEDDALTYSLNVENSVEKLTWVDAGRIACCTQSSDLQVWDTGSGDQLRSYGRDKLAKSIKRSRIDDCCLVDTFTPTDDTPAVLVGSNGGNRDVLRTVTMGDKKLQPSSNFSENRQIVRCCWYQRDRDILITAGEAGIINVWSGACAGAEDTSSGARAGAEDAGGPARTAKRLSNSLSQLHVHRHKPY